MEGEERGGVRRRKEGEEVHREGVWGERSEEREERGKR